MLSLLSFLVDTVNMAIQFLLNTLVSLVNLVRLIPTFVTYTTSLFAWLPQPFYLFALLGLSLSVILFLLGRQT